MAEWTARARSHGGRVMIAARMWAPAAPCSAIQAAGGWKASTASQTPDGRANGNEGISRIVGRLGTCRPGIDDDIPVRGRVEVPKQRHNCVGGGTNLSNQVGFIGPSDAGQGVADVRRGLRHDVNSSLVGG